MIKTEGQYDAAIERMEAIFDSEPGSKHFDELELLLVLISDYEDRNFEEITMPNPIEVIKLKMEEKGMKQKDLEPILGSKSYVSALLNGKRNITMKAAIALHKVLNVPAHTFFVAD